MDKEKALNELLAKCFDARLAEYQLCDRANVSRATLSRWKSNPDMIRVTTLVKMEDALKAYIKEHAA